MEYKQALDVIVSEVKKVVSKALENASYDKTYSGMIISSASKECVVRINGKDRKIKINNSRTAGEYVHVLVPMNNWNNAVLISTL